MNSMKWIGLGIGIILLIITLVGGTVITPAGHVNVVLRFGRAIGVKTDGLSFRMPLIDNLQLMSIQTQLFEVENAEAASRDMQDVAASIAINYKIEPQYASDIYRTLGTDYIKKIAYPVVQEVVKSVTANYDAQDLILRREDVKNVISTELGRRLGERHIITETINITNFNFSEEFTKSIEAKMVAAQKVIEAENTLRRIEVEARQAEQKAKGEAAAAIARAEGQSEANRILADSLTPELLQYTFIDKVADQDVDKILVIPYGSPITLPAN